MVTWTDIVGAIATSLAALATMADLVGKYVVCNIGGNNDHLITVIHWNTQKIYIRAILTHAEYNKDQWK
jgi:mRNA interferase HigB